VVPPLFAVALTGHGLSGRECRPCSLTGATRPVLLRGGRRRAKDAHHATTSPHVGLQPLICLRFFRRLGGLDHTGGIPRNLAPIVRSLRCPSSGPCPRHCHMPVRLWKFDPCVNPRPSLGRGRYVPVRPRLLAGRQGGSPPRRSPRRCPRVLLSSGHEIHPQC